MASERRWIPLESNPKVLNKYIGNLGVDDKWQFVDIYGMDSELLMMVPRPVAAVMLLYPLTEKVKEKDIGDVEKEYKGFFIKQTIPNACGTVALIHALANNEHQISFDAEKNFRKFLNSTKDMKPDERGQYLEADEGLTGAHEESAQEGDTQAPSRDSSVRPHFIAFVHKDGNLYELDGRKESAVCHGKTTQDALLEDAIKVVKSFMDRDPEEINFTLMALAKVD